MFEINHNHLTNRKNRPALRDPKRYALRQLKGLVVHWTANTSPGATDEAHKRYFNRADIYASAHVFIDDDSITEIIPTDEVAYHVGCVLPSNRNSKSWKATDVGTGLGTWEHGRWLNPNYTTVGVEACVNKDGDFVETYKKLVWYCNEFIIKNNLQFTDLYRHFDVCSKPCPAFMLRPALWEQFMWDVIQNDPSVDCAEKMYETMWEQLSEKKYKRNSKNKILKILLE